MRLLPLILLLAFSPAMAAEPKPEVERSEAAPQAVGVAHALRTIPEACARIQGQFTGDAAQPYKFSLVRTSARCQPRAKLVDAAKVRPSLEKGWVFNDLIRVPSKACPSLQAVVRVWRKPAANATPDLDAQGAARIYLEDAKKAAAAGDIAAVGLYAASMEVEGESCQ